MTNLELFNWLDKPINNVTSSLDKTIDEQPVFNVIDEQPVFNVIDEHTKFNVIDEQPVYNIIDEPPKLNDIDEQPVYNIIDEPPKLNFIDENPNLIKESSSFLNNETEFSKTDNSSSFNFIDKNPIEENNLIDSNPLRLKEESNLFNFIDENPSTNQEESKIENSSFLNFIDKIENPQLINNEISKEINSSTSLNFIDSSESSTEEFSKIFNNPEFDSNVKIINSELKEEGGINNINNQFHKVTEQQLLEKTEKVEEIYQDLPVLGMRTSNNPLVLGMKKINNPPVLGMKTSNNPLVLGMKKINNHPVLGMKTSKNPAFPESVFSNLEKEDSGIHEDLPVRTNPSIPKSVLSNQEKEEDSEIPPIRNEISQLPTLFQYQVPSQELKGRPFQQQIHKVDSLENMKIETEINLFSSIQPTPYISSNLEKSVMLSPPLVPQPRNFQTEVFIPQFSSNEFSSNEFPEQEEEEYEEEESNIFNQLSPKFNSNPRKMRSHRRSHSVSNPDGDVTPDLPNPIETNINESFTRSMSLSRFPGDKNIIRPRALVTFGFGGKLAYIQPHKSRSQPSKLVDFSSSKSDFSIKEISLKSLYPELGRFPGPIESTSKAIKFIEQEIESPTIHKDKRILLKIIKSLLRNSGTLKQLFRPDNQELLQILEPIIHYEEYNVQRKRHSNVLTQLISGDREGALEICIREQNWAQALLIASRMSADIYRRVAREYSNATFLRGSPMSMVVSVFTEDVEEVIQTKLENWIETVGILCKNPTSNTSKSLKLLGEKLLKNGKIEAAHSCFILGGHLPGEEWELVGTKNRTIKGIQLSEILEYGLKLGNSQFKLPHIIQHKLYYSLILAEVGFMKESWKYCDNFKSGTPLSLSAESFFLRLNQHLNKNPSQKWYSGIVKKIDRGINRLIDGEGGGESPTLTEIQNSSTSSQFENLQILNNQSKMFGSNQTTEISEPNFFGEIPFTKTKKKKKMENSEDGFEETDVYVHKVSSSSNIKSKVVKEQIKATPESIKRNIKSSDSQEVGEEEDSGFFKKVTRSLSFLSFRRTKVKSEKSKSIEADLGEKNKFYYDSEKGEWVVEGEEDIDEESSEDSIIPEDISIDFPSSTTQDSSSKVSSSENFIIPKYVDQIGIPNSETNSLEESSKYSFDPLELFGGSPEIISGIGGGLGGGEVSTFQPTFIPNNQLVGSGGRGEVSTFQPIFIPNNQSVKSQQQSTFISNNQQEIIENKSIDPLFGLIN